MVEKLAISLELAFETTTETPRRREKEGQGLPSSIFPFIEKANAGVATECPSFENQRPQSPDRWFFSLRPLRVSAVVSTTWQLGCSSVGGMLLKQGGGP